MINTNVILKSALFKITAAFLFLLITVIPAANASVISYKKEANGLLFTLDKGRMKITICTDDIIQVKYTIFDVKNNVRLVFYLKKHIHVRSLDFSSEVKCEVNLQPCS